MSWPPPIRVAGLGSPHGDDAAGWEIVRQLQGCLGRRGGFKCHLLEGGQKLLDILDGQGSLLLVDALSGGTAPGTIQRFEWPDARVEGLRPGTTHDMSPAQALQLAAVLGLSPQRIVVYGVEIGDVQSTPVFSPPVAAAIPTMVQRIADEIMSNLEKD